MSASSAPSVRWSTIPISCAVAASIAEQPREPLRPAVAGEEAQPDLRLAEARQRLGHAVVTGERELHPAAECHALDRRHARLPHALDAPECELRIVGKDARLLDGVHLLQELPDVGAGHEARRPLAREDHRADVVTPREVVDDDVQLVERALVEGVHRRIGDEDRRHAAFTGGLVMKTVATRAPGATRLYCTFT